MSLRAALIASKKLAEEATSEYENLAASAPPKKKTTSKSSSEKKIKSTRKKFVDLPVHPIPAPKTAFLLHAGATYENARETAGTEGMTSHICLHWSKLTKSQREKYVKKETKQKKSFEKSQTRSQKNCPQRPGPIRGGARICQNDGKNDQSSKKRCWQ